MIRISRLTDYGLVLLTFMAVDPEHPLSATELAGGTGLPLPTVSKLLQILTKEGLLASHRGAKGGYALARSADDISVAHIVAALEGPVALTLCTEEPTGECEYEHRCRIRGHLLKINHAIQDALKAISLSEMAASTPGVPSLDGAADAPAVAASAAPGPG